MRCFQQNFITPFIYSKIGSTSSGAALAAAVPALPELRNPQFAAAASEQAVNAAPDLPVPLFSRPVPGCAAVPWIAPLVVLLSVHSSLAAPFPISHKGGFDRQPLPSTGCRWLTVHTSKMLVLSAFHRQPILSTDRQPL